ncbi:MAG: Histidine kinase-, DNA gyrase B-, and [Parcubacteria group bacterium GW2011_GWC1_36_9]|nr:MAG: Histidine kinase-, DNA gyrase B-, and [Parcubacteria group bacterium GW2011_GWC1_36_9]
MIDINTTINTCYETTNSLRVVANYSHIIPVVLSLILGTFVFIKAKFNLFSKVFLAFIIVFSLWLIGDAIIWTSNNYHLIYAIWSSLVYIEVVFYILGFYFATVFVKKSDISISWKIVLFVLTLPALFITITQQSVTGFNYPVCEAFNNNFLDQYKLIIEGIILIIILIYILIPFFKRLPWNQKKDDLMVLGSTFLFLSVFGITEYLASITGYYEMNLYSLFLLPIFLVAIIYSVFELDIFNFHILGTHYLVVGLIVLMGGQLFFVTSTANRLLTILTIILLVGLSIILFRNLKRESDQRVHIEKLNIQLESLLKQRESLVHLVTHKIKGSFTRSKYIFAGLLDGTFGETNPAIQKVAKMGLESEDAGIHTVDLVLDVANMQKGVVKYEMKVIDFKEIIFKTFAEKKIQAEERGLQMESKIHDSKDDIYSVLGDVFWLREAINNLIDNAIKYTKEGKITINLEDGNGKIKFSIKDTGIGITDEDKKSLFTEGGRGKDSVKINVDSTGYGLYSVKLIIEAHKGKVWAESEGPGKGSAFYVELDAVV